MKYAVLMGAGAMIYIPSNIKISYGIYSKVNWGDSETHRQHGDPISLLLFPAYFPYFEIQTNTEFTFKRRSHCNF
jgi:hypothetical protein